MAQADFSPPPPNTDTETLSNGHPTHIFWNQKLFFAGTVAANNQGGYGWYTFEGEHDPPSSAYKSMYALAIGQHCFDWQGRE